MRSKFFCIFILTLIECSSIFAQVNVKPAALENISFIEHLGTKVDGNLSFKQSDGKDVLFSEILMRNKVTILNLVYFKCPMLCGLVTTGLSDALKHSNLKLGEKFQVITVSIDPNDTYEKAAEIKKRYVAMSGLSDEEASSWSFWVSDSTQIKKLATTVGFPYKYNSITKEYSHAAGIILLSPSGVLTRYLYGVEFNPFDFKMAILESAKGLQKSPVERVLLFCYNYDVHARKYSIYALNLLRATGILTLIGLFSMFFILRKRRTV